MVLSHPRRISTEPFFFFFYMITLMMGVLTRGKTLQRNNVGTSVTMTADTTVPVLLEQSYHSLGTGVTTSIKQV